MFSPLAGASLAARGPPRGTLFSGGQNGTRKSCAGILIFEILPPPHPPHGSEHVSALPAGGSAAPLLPHGMRRVRNGLPGSKEAHSSPKDSWDPWDQWKQYFPLDFMYNQDFDKLL